MFSKKNSRQLALAAVMIGSMVGTGVMSAAAQDTTTTTPAQGRGPGISILDGADLADSPMAITAANALGIDADTLVADLQAGQTLAQIAEAQNVDVQTVYDALTAKYKALLDAEVTAGFITQEQADTQLTTFTANVANFQFLRGGRGGRPGMNGGQPNGQPPQNGTNNGQPPANGNMPQMGNAANSPVLTAVAGALGIDTTTLLTDLQAGQSLTDIAAAQNVDIQTVYDALIAQQKTLLDAAVASGYLTQAQADARLETFTANVANYQLFGGRAPQGGFPGGANGSGPQGNFGSGNGPQGGFGGGRGGNGPQGGFPGANGTQDFNNNGTDGTGTQPLPPMTLNGANT